MYLFHSNRGFLDASGNTLENMRKILLVSSPCNDHRLYWRCCSLMEKRFSDNVVFINAHDYGTDVSYRNSAGSIGKCRRWPFVVCVKEVLAIYHLRKCSTVNDKPKQSIRMLVVTWIIRDSYLITINLDVVWKPVTSSMVIDMRWSGWWWTAL